MLDKRVDQSAPEAEGLEERRYVRGHVELRQEGEGGPTIEMFIPYDVETDVLWWREVIRPSFFQRAIEESQDIVAWYQHGDGGQFPLGRVSSGHLVLEQTATGLRALATPPDRPWVQDLITSLERKDVNGSSFAFYALKERWTEEEGKPPLRELLDGEIWDVSPVVFPAYPYSQAKIRESIELVFERAKHRGALKAPLGTRDAAGHPDGRAPVGDPSNQAIELDIRVRRAQIERDYLSALHRL